jgi:lipid-A-disaccharide synthase-like uncharacterized protein
LTNDTASCVPLLMLAARPAADAADAAAAQPDVWLYVGLAAQGLIAVSFMWQWMRSNRLGRFWMPPLLAAVGVAATAALLAYAVARHEPVFTVGQAIYLVVALRMLYLARRYQQRLASAQWPSFPRVSPEVAEQRHSETAATLSGEFKINRK